MGNRSAVARARNWREGGIIKREHNSLLPGMEQFCTLTVVVMPHVINLTELYARQLARKKACKNQQHLKKGHLSWQHHRNVHFSVVTMCY